MEENYKRLQMEEYDDEIEAEDYKMKKKKNVQKIRSLDERLQIFFLYSNDGDTITKNVLYSLK